MKLFLIIRYNIKMQDANNDEKSLINPVWQATIGYILGISLGGWIVNNPYRPYGKSRPRSRNVIISIYRTDDNYERLHKATKRFRRALDSKALRWCGYLADFYLTETSIVHNGKTVYISSFDFYPYTPEEEAQVGSYEVKVFRTPACNGHITLNVGPQAALNYYYDRVNDEMHRRIINENHARGVNIRDFILDYEAIADENDRLKAINAKLQEELSKHEQRLLN